MGLADQFREKSRALAERAKAEAEGSSRSEDEVADEQARDARDARDRDDA